MKAKIRSSIDRRVVLVQGDAYEPAKEQPPVIDRERYRTDPYYAINRNPAWNATGGHVWMMVTGPKGLVSAGKGINLTPDEAEGIAKSLMEAAAEARKAVITSG